MALNKHEGQAAFYGNQSQVFNAVVATVQGIRGMTLQMADPASGYIGVDIAFNFWSYGERIAIQVTETAPGQTWVQVSSSSKFAIWDFGRNQRNVSKILVAVEQAVAGGAGPYQAQPPGQACGSCGAALAADSRFCTSCGSQRA
jgi:hypothetical protein